MPGVITIPKEADLEYKDKASHLKLQTIMQRKILYSDFHIDTRSNIPHPLQKTAMDSWNYCISKSASITYTSEASGFLIGLYTLILFL